MYQITICLVVLFSVLLCPTGQIPPEPQKNHPSSEQQDNHNDKKHIQINLQNVHISEASFEGKDHILSDKKIAPTANVTKNATQNVSRVKPQEETKIEMESGAITRGVLVFVVISFLFIIYVGIRTYRRKSTDKRHTVVKYGIKTRRTDIEMEPLPLSDDEEDETLFELAPNRGTTN